MSELTEEAVDRLFDSHPEPTRDPEECKCKSKWLERMNSPDPSLYELWRCTRCGSKSHRLMPQDRLG